MLRALVLGLGLVVSVNAWAQEPDSFDEERRGRTAKNVIYAEGLGAGLFYSVNYERNVLDFLSVRAGIGYFPLSVSAGTSSASSHYVTIPLMVNYLGLGSLRHMLELGAGGTLLFVAASATGQSGGGLVTVTGSGLTGFFNFQVGYRFQPAHGGFHFRIGLMALVGPGLPLGGGSTTDPNTGAPVVLWGALPWPYMSFGGVF